MGLKLLGNAWASGAFLRDLRSVSKLSDEQFKLLLETLRRTAGDLSHRAVHSELQSAVGFDNAEPVLRATSAFSYLLAEAVANDVSTDDLISDLRQVGMSEQETRILAERFTEAVDIAP